MADTEMLFCSIVIQFNYIETGSLQLIYIFLKLQKKTLLKSAIGLLFPPLLTIFSPPRNINTPALGTPSELFQILFIRHFFAQSYTCTFDYCTQTIGHF